MSAALRPGLFRQCQRKLTDLQQLLVVLFSPALVYFSRGREERRQYLKERSI